MVQLAFVASVALLWHFATASGRVSPLLLPPLQAVWRELVALIGSARFWPDLRVTLYELAVAFLIAAVAGSAAGYAVSRSSYAVRVFDPLFAGMYSIPAILLFPLYVLFFGLGTGSKIAMGATIAFFPVVLNTITGLRQVDRSYVSAAQSMGASSFQMFWSVMLPASLPVILAGLRIGAISAFMTILGAETIASFAGMGHRIVELAENMDTAKMFANIVLVMFIALLLNAAVALAERSGRRT
jgi:ABC-type nitrate/sulfonate/bicarbonate transport system permease component